RAQRYTTSTAGYDGWLFTRHDQQVRQMGLLDPEYYVPPHSRHETRVRAINDAGQAVGYTNNDPSSSSGPDHGWYYDPATGTTTRIGYSTFPGVHPYTEDRPTYLLENGFVAGTSVLSTSSGRPLAWIYDPAVGVTQMVGLPESTDVGPNNEPLFQTLEAVTPNKLVVGTSGRNPGPSGPFHGAAVWVHRPGAAESERIGLYDESYTRKDLQKI